MLSPTGPANGTPLGIKVGEYGFEDVINEGDPNGKPNSTAIPTPEPGEDVSGDGLLQTYGGTNLGLGFRTGGGAITPDEKVGTLSGGASGCAATRKNWVSGARHGVRLINGTLGNLPLRKTPSPDPNNTQAFTLASENPVYISGNFNANNAAGFGDPHGSAAVIADAVTLLSQGWSDDGNGFANPTGPGGRPASSSNFRLA